MFPSPPTEAKAIRHAIGTNIPYTFVASNNGNSINVNAGVFTALVDGTYFFTFTARANSNGTRVDLLINGFQSVTSFGASEGDYMSLHTTVNLTSGRTVSIQQRRTTVNDIQPRMNEFKINGYASDAIIRRKVTAKMPRG